MGLIDRLARGIFAGTIQREVRQALALAETDNTFTAGAFPAGESPRDRLSPDRNESYSQAMEAWRVEPAGAPHGGTHLAYVVGEGSPSAGKHRATNFSWARSGITGSTTCLCGYTSGVMSDPHRQPVPAGLNRPGRHELRAGGAGRPDRVHHPRG